ncbi:MAG: hypothetical protein RL488_1057 [Actinomycetota bacterium]|jgi:uncharacterized membrane protein YedE/YeeE
MNIGPSGKASWFEIALAVFFVLLVFGIFIFAVATPLVSYFVTHKERWPEYSKKERAKVIRTVSTVALSAVILVWLTTSPFSNS